MPPILIWIIAGIVGAGAGSVLGRLVLARIPRVQPAQAPLFGAAIGVAVAMVAASAITTPSDGYRRVAIVDELNRDLPKKVDDVTTLTKVAFEDGRLTFLYSLAGELDPARLPAVRSSVLPAACQTFGDEFRAGHVTSVTYSYAGTASTRTVLVEPKDCGV